MAKPGVSIATIAQDYAFGRDGVAAYKAAVEKAGAKVVHEEYTPTTATDFTAPIQKIIAALKDKPGQKYVFVIWAGKGGPFPQLVDNRLDKYGITLTSGSNVLDVLKAMKSMKLEGMVGGAYYYYEIPKNPVNDWLVREHTKRFNEPPDFFTCGGFAAAMAAVAVIQKAGGTDTEKLIAAMEGLEFQTITAVVIGGTSIFGGRGSIGKTLIGAIIVGLILNGLQLLSVSIYYNQFLSGLILLVAVVLDMLRQRKSLD